MYLLLCEYGINQKLFIWPTWQYDINNIVNDHKIKLSSERNLLR